MVILLLLFSFSFFFALSTHVTSDSLMLGGAKRTGLFRLLIDLFYIKPQIVGNKIAYSLWTKTELVEQLQSTYCSERIAKLITSLITALIIKGFLLHSACCNALIKWLYDLKSSRWWSVLNEQKQDGTAWQMAPTAAGVRWYSSACHENSFRHKRISVSDRFFVLFPHTVSYSVPRLDFYHSGCWLKDRCFNAVTYMVLFQTF